MNSNHEDVGPNRCGWAMTDLARRYHDEEWGVPLHDDRKHFEFIILDGFQAGLSWNIMLQKREGMRRAFHNFDPVRIARYNDRSVERLLADPRIIRNRQKINAAILNARGFLKLQDEFGQFDRYIWRFVDGKTKVNAWKTLKELPARTPESDVMSKDLIQRGFKFVGSTICYAYMQAAGMVNDHTIDCFRREELIRANAKSASGPARSARR